MARTGQYTYLALNQTFSAKSSKQNDYYRATQLYAWSKQGKQYRWFPWEPIKLEVCFDKNQLQSHLACNATSQLFVYCSTRFSATSSRDNRAWKIVSSLKKPPFKWNQQLSSPLLKALNLKKITSLFIERQHSIVFAAVSVWFISRNAAPLWHVTDFM